MTGTKAGMTQAVVGQSAKQSGGRSRKFKIRNSKFKTKKPKKTEKPNEPKRPNSHSEALSHSEGVKYSVASQLFRRNKSQQIQNSSAPRSLPARAKRGVTSIRHSGGSIPFRRNKFLLAVPFCHSSSVFNCPYLPFIALNCPELP